MRNKLMLVILLAGICYWRPQIFAEEKKPLSEKELKQMLKEREIEERAAHRKMDALYKAKLKALDELNRAKQREYASTDYIKSVFTDPQSLTDDKRRIEQTQNRYENIAREYNETIQIWKETVEEKEKVERDLEERKQR